MNFFDKSFVKNIFRLSAGAFSSQLLSLGFIFVSAKFFFDETDFGNQSLFLTYAAFLSIIATFKLELGIVLQTTDDDREKIFRAGLTLSFVFCLAILILLSLLVLLGVSKFFMLDANWLLALPFSVFFISATQMCWMWYTHYGSFKILSVSRLIEVVTFIVVATLLWVFGFKSYSLLFATVISQAAIFFILFFKTGLTRSFNYSQAKHTLIANKQIPVNNIFLSFYDIIQNNPINIFGPLFFSIADIGFYNFAIKFLQVPIWLIFKPLSNVFLNDIAQHKLNLPMLINKSRSLMKVLIPIAIVFVLGCLLLGPFLFKTIFGTKWEIAGLYLGFFAIFYSIDFLRMSVSYISLILNKQHLISIVSLFLLGLIIVGFYFIASNNLLSVNNKFLAIALLQAFASIFVLVFIFKRILRK